jgi:hypothetical protein
VNESGRRKIQGTISRVPEETEESYENRRENSNVPDRYRNPEFPNAKPECSAHKSDIQLSVNTIIRDTLFCLSLECCTLLYLAVPCSLQQLIAALIRPLITKGRADRKWNTEALHDAQQSAYLVKVTQIKTIGKYKFKIRLKRKNKVTKTQPLLRGYRQIKLETDSFVVFECAYSREQDGTF